jgi:hypothetical protein
MTQEQAKREFIRLWRGLPHDQRKTDEQAAAFAMQHKDDFHFEAAGEPYRVIKGWLQDDLAMTSRSTY